MRIIVLIALVVFAAASGLAAEEKDAVPTGDRVFEMRTYHAADGKIDALHARFRDHTSRLFEKHGMTIIGYWVQIDKTSGAPNSNQLVYILAYPTMEAREASWKAFQSDPVWQKAKAESEANGRLVERVDSVFLKPTDYSPVK